jgi:hypothetical protein
MKPKQEYDPRLTKPLKYSLRTCKPDDLSLLEVLSLFFLNLPRGIMASNPSMIAPGTIFMYYCFGSRGMQFRTESGSKQYIETILHENNV